MSSPQSLFAYIGCGGAGDVCLVRYANDSLELIERVTLPGLEKAGGSMPLCLSPDQRHLYAAGRGTPMGIFTFAIDSESHRLSPVSTFPIEESVAYLACTTRDGRLFSASYHHNLVAAYELSSEGGVQGEQGRHDTEPNAHCILPDPDQRNLLFTSLGGDRLYCASLEAQPPFSDTTEVTLPHGTGPRHLIFNDAGTQLYLLGELDGSITLFDYDSSTRTMKEKQRVVVDKGEADTFWAADIHLDAEGGYLFASERSSSLVTSFEVDADSGELTRIDAFEVEAQPRGFALDASGQVMLVAGQASHHVAAYRLDQGRLEFIDRVEVAQSPDWVEMV
ncbi:lactonase family protein [Kushneria indalinina]|uniref:6-phosphogluconolactonase n=1 Tax=Kushneria indalinina DSM 14324 TaxID=1122140 RepID=A0A3D9DX56_9GAMM|nr:beta-propeller fold lactonase family protein [Kushneria indalinina]REC95360.1 6-phosphogluconolactonase [Kushneria indalinina DSM 14324]